MRIKKYVFRFNNYQIGAKLKSCPIEKIIKKEKEDEKHTLVWFENLTGNELTLINKLLGQGN